MPIPGFLRRKTIEEIEKETELARFGAAAWRRTARAAAPVRKGFLEDYEERAKGKGLRAKLMEDLEAAWTDEEKAAVIEHHIRSLMSRGWRRQAAERRIIRLLTEAEESEEAGGY